MRRSPIIEHESPCLNCNNRYLKLSWQVFENGVRHLRADCNECGKYVKYIPQTHDMLEIMENAK